MPALTVEGQMGQPLARQRPEVARLDDQGLVQIWQGARCYLPLRMILQNGA